MQPIGFAVSYELREYRSFVREHATHLIKRRRRTRARTWRTPLDVFAKPMLLKALVGALAIPVFLLKRRRASCRIDIDGAGRARIHPSEG